MEGGSYMIKDLFDESGHLSKVGIEEFKDGSLDDSELIQVSEHICICNICADRLSNSFEEIDLLEVPLGFGEEVKNKIKDSKESKRDFIFYSFKVGIAACIAIVFMYSNILGFVAGNGIKKNIKTSNFSVVTSINNRLSSFSQKMINMEVFKHEKEKK